MKVTIQSSKLVKPLYDDNAPIPPVDMIPLSIFDKISWNMHVAIIYAYRPPTASNASIELGLRKVLASYREMAGRLNVDEDGEMVIVRNDKGVRFIEASTDRVLDETISFMPSEKVVHTLHPNLYNVEELTQVQITRFACGSMVLGFTLHHMVTDANGSASFLVAWSKASRNVEIIPPFQDRTIFIPRETPIFQFDHKGAEFKPKELKKYYDNHVDERANDICAEKFVFTAEFISNIKTKASSFSNKRPFSTFESIVAHVWRAITKARGLSGSEMTRVRISVDCRNRIKNPKVPNNYLGNMVLWAYATSKVEELLNEPVGFAAKLLHEAVLSVNDDYIKSFIDFAHYRAKSEGLLPTITVESKKMIFSPDMDAGSWLRLPFYDLDFGGGAPYMFSPCFSPMEGDVFLMPSFSGDGSIEVFVPLFRENMKVFKNVCYSLD